MQHVADDHLSKVAPHAGHHQVLPLHGDAMVFTYSVDCVLLFSWWHPTTLPQYVLSLLVIFLVSVTSEWCGGYTRRISPFPRNFNAISERRPLVSSLNQSLVAASKLLPLVLLNISSVALAYVTMLFAMTMNVGVFVTVVIGLSIGRVTFAAFAFPNDSRVSNVCDSD